MLKTSKVVIATATKAKSPVIVPEKPTLVKYATVLSGHL
jgi:hypothetical protein